MKQADYAIIHNTLQKIQQTQKPLRWIYRQLRMQNRLMKKLLVVLIDILFSDQRYNLGEVGQCYRNE
jgi:hypothetical protein